MSYDAKLTDPAMLDIIEVSVHDSQDFLSHVNLGSLTVFVLDIWMATVMAKTA